MRAWSFLVCDLVDITPFQEFPNDAASAIKCFESSLRQKLVPEAASRQAKLLNTRSTMFLSKGQSPVWEVSSGFHCVRLDWWGVLFPSFPSPQYLYIPYSFPEHFSEAANPLPCNQVLWNIKVVTCVCYFGIWLYFFFLGVILFVLHLSLPCILISFQSLLSLLFLLSLVTHFNSTRWWEFC